jgi:hypothetical protein
METWRVLLVGGFLEAKWQADTADAMSMTTANSSLIFT